LNGTVLKTVILERVSGVRIPELPQKFDIYMHDTINTTTKPYDTNQKGK